MLRPLLALLVLALLVGCGPSAASAPTSPPELPASTPAPTAPPTLAPTGTPLASASLEAGARVDIGGRALLLQCSAPVVGAPTVILEAGLGADHASWALVAPDAAAYARVCSYDRAGLGRSDPGPAPRDAAAASADLTALLAAAGVPGPYILVGHSFGGLFARHFAAANPDSVVGLVLADAVSEEWWTSALAALPPESAEESERLRSFRRFLSVDVADPARNAEGVDIRAVAAQVRAAPPLGGKPLVVLVAAIPDVLAPGLPPAVERELVALLQDELPRAMAASSADSTVIVVPESGHNIPQQRPDMIVLAIQAVLAAVAQ